ncbi:uncharacterized protein BYT42DRAFT_618345 [Radiomyces spectabilis]|uniref:uncharacterized protein n=1 Tax=Radiomyces spectabilis TaxID=64574 RepID=UPI002220178D|nr:uncharacterized protein BYT42DRAFT_618345 [Radiomyces spectabilis]KAI8366839.1 hypothetical protein BYT42DRAFT_618345 [Radiomyces spectabilis]
MAINNDDHPQSELDMLEHAMNSMMQGTFSLLFKNLLDPSIFDDRQFPAAMDQARITNGEPLVESEGSDFRRIAQKARRQRNPDESTEAPEEIVSAAGHTWGSDKDVPVGFPSLSTLFASMIPSDNMTWSSSSTSTRSVVHPDGTEETTTVQSRNGVTETIKKVRYPDGTIEETRQNSSQPSPAVTMQPNSDFGQSRTSNHEDPPKSTFSISQLWNSFFR